MFTFFQHLHHMSVVRHVLHNHLTFCQMLLSVRELEWVFSVCIMCIVCIIYIICIVYIIYIMYIICIVHIPTIPNWQLLHILYNLWYRLTPLDWLMYRKCGCGYARACFL